MNLLRHIYFAFQKTENLQLIKGLFLSLSSLHIHKNYVKIQPRNMHCLKLKHSVAAAGCGHLVSFIAFKF
jgi:hypothetical protein